MRNVYNDSENSPHNRPRRAKFGTQTTDEMAIAFLQVALPHREDVRAFRRTVGAFDKNHNGKLEPDEVTALLQFLQGSVK